jgi:hypothetical protein
MTERASIFDSGTDFDVSGFAPQKPKPAAPPEKVRTVAEKSEFKSREVEQKRPAREPRRYRTGRNMQLNLKADPAVIEAFYKLADEHGWVLGEAFEMAVEALKAKLAAA